MVVNTSDMLRRNCTPDSITTNRRVLERFMRGLTPNGEEIRLSHVTQEKVEVEKLLEPINNNTFIGAHTSFWVRRTD